MHRLHIFQELSSTVTISIGYSVSVSSDCYTCDYLFVLRDYADAHATESLAGSSHVSFIIPHVVGGEVRDGHPSRQSQIEIQNMRKDPVALTRQLQENISYSVKKEVTLLELFS